MNTETLPTRDQLNQLSGAIISSAIEVHRQMGPGLLESIYQYCLITELRSRSIRVDEAIPIQLHYKTATLDKRFVLDLLVDNEVILEIKSVDEIAPIHEAQLLSYMKLTKKRLGLLLNFNVPLMKEGIKRIALNL
jgi:GxxExxY protein